MYQLVAYLHLLAAVVWLGGMLFIAMVLVPVTRASQGHPAAGARFLRLAAQRFRLIGWAALLLLAGTGLYVMIERGVAASELFTGTGWFIQVLRVKIGLFLLVLVLSILHDFVLGPSLSRQIEGASKVPPGAQATLLRQRRLVAWLARLNLVLALAIMALGVLMVRGLPI